VDQKPTILIADFFGTVKERGIAAYVRDLEAVAEPIAKVITLRAPTWVRGRPQAVQNLLMVFHEQLIVPLHALFRRPDLILFPYNTGSFLLSLSPRTVCVIHDLIPYKRRDRRLSLSFLYVACTAKWHARLGRRLVAVSSFTARTLKAIPLFKRCSVTVIPNCFSADSRAEWASASIASKHRVTLISGIGANKAFPRTLELMAFAKASDGLTDLEFDVVGFGPEHERATVMIADARARGLKLPSIKVHPLISRAELDSMLAENAVTWVHSRAEGFGRVLVEGRMAGRPVVMSKLPVFRALRDSFTFGYRNDDSAAFAQAMRSALRFSESAERYGVVTKLRTDALIGLQTLISR